MRFFVPDEARQDRTLLQQGKDVAAARQLDKLEARAAIDIPLAPPVIEWLQELQVFACGEAHLFPAPGRVNLGKGVARKDRFQHISPDTLDVALKRLHLKEVEHFTDHDMRRTALGATQG